MRKLKVNKLLLLTTILILVTLTSMSYAESIYKIKPTDNLSRIADKFYKGSKLSRSQIYIGILADNPKAFRLGNINHLKNGQILKLPESSKLLTMESIDAANLVAEHNNNASKGLRTKIDPPFKDYSPNNSSNNDSSLQTNENTNTVAIKQQVTSQEELNKLNSESESLRKRLEQLIADKEAMDAELLQLDNLIKQK